MLSRINKHHCIRPFLWPSTTAHHNPRFQVPQYTYVLSHQCRLNIVNLFFSVYLEARAMSRSVTLVKGKNNMIGISIGGGAPFCPVLYVVQVRRYLDTSRMLLLTSLLSLSSSLLQTLLLQVFHRTPAYENGSLCPGDELVTVNGTSLRGLSRKQTADMIQSSKVRMYIQQLGEELLSGGRVCVYVCIYVMYV